MQRVLLAFSLPFMVGACSDYALKGKPPAGEEGVETLDSGVSEPDEVPQDTGIDDDPDPQTETETEPEPETEKIDHEVVLRLSADDQWEAWMDGFWIDQQEGWNQVGEYSYTLSSGMHVVAVRVDDLHLIINGFIAEMAINGQVWTLTGQGEWRVTDVEPDPGWTQPEYVDTDWGVPVVCVDDAPWSGIPTLVNADAEWIWHDADCREELGTSWFRLAFELP